MIDTIVIHHSGGSEHDASSVADQHAHRRTSSKDPWYMVGYSFMLNVPFTEPSRVSDARPLDIVGAHAGEEAYVPMTFAQQKMWDEGKVVCGHEGGPFKKDEKYLLKNGKIKANVTTIGMVVMGNFSESVGSNGKRIPADKVTPEVIDSVARMACQLQLEHPTIQFLSLHKVYKATACPGHLGKHLPQIIARARNYGCVFR